jgi:hypothetical protein
MASGPGDKSRLYKTTDRCKSWKLMLKNKDKKGFWDAFDFRFNDLGYLLGDPVDGEFQLFLSFDRGKHWKQQHNERFRTAEGTQGAFAASNSSLTKYNAPLAFGSGGSGGAFLYSLSENESCADSCRLEDEKWVRQPVPVGNNTDSSGVFSIGARVEGPAGRILSRVLMAVGGDYSKPSDSHNTAAFRLDFNEPWTAASVPPHGYRSSVEWSEDLNAWFTAGTNGSDISRDDGKTWSPIDDGNWNALSLPFVVGPKGRIARLSVAGK